MLLRIAFLLLGMSLVVAELVLSHRSRRWGNITRYALGLIAAANLLFVGFLWVNHTNFPLNLDLMEGTVFQHFQRAAEFKPIYPEPTPAYVPLAYNALYYVFAVPFSWLFGVNLFTLRLVAILGMLGSGLILYTIVRQKTGSAWWGLITVGLFAAAYHIMDAYLDTAHADSWFLCSALLGSLLIDRNRSRLWNLLGVLILVASFWFKQHGALFVIGGVLFLTWREGLRRSWPFWLAALVFGPLVYVFAGPRLFGSHFHYFTWHVPRHWSELSLGTFSRFAMFIANSYPLLALSGALLLGWAILRKRDSLDIWHVQFIFAVLTGLMGSLDPGSSDNVYIPAGTWFILVGVLGLHTLAVQLEAAQRYKIHAVALMVTFAVLVYNPRDVMTSPNAQASYAELVGLLNGLQGSVYAPWLGQLQSGYALYPAAHWVALDDLTRGPGHDFLDNSLARQLIEPAVDPKQAAFILTNYPLETTWIACLEGKYVLETDFGDRFKPLRVLPRRWDHGWPRYLYRYTPGHVATKDSPSCS